MIGKHRPSAFEWRTRPLKQMTGSVLIIAALFASLILYAILWVIMPLEEPYYEQPERIVNAINELRLRGNDLIVFHLLDPTEVTFEFTETGSFEDLETGERLAVIPEQFRAEYRERVQAHIAELRRQLGNNRVDYAFFDTSQPLDHLLFRYLSDRARLAHTR